MNKRTKIALWVAGLVAALVGAITLGSTLWEVYSVRSAVRFSVQLQKGTNEIELALWRGQYVYQVASEPALGLGTIVRPNTNVVVRTSVTHGETLLIYESARQSQSFTISDTAGSPVKIVVHLDSARVPVYFSFRRGL
jgi:hypothetical protein